MNSKDIAPLINQAITLLKSQPFDAGHDLAYAQAVWKTARDIADHLKPTPGTDQAPTSGVNITALKLACYWHDVVVKPKDQLKPAGENVADTAAYLKTQLKKHQFPSDFINIVYLAVRYHQYEDKPVNLEGQILWDADKLEVINLNRWLLAHRAVETGHMPQATYDSYLNTALKWLKVLRPKYHFDYSRTLFDQRIKAVTSHPKFQQLAFKHQLNINEIIPSR